MRGIIDWIKGKREYWVLVPVIIALLFISRCESCNKKYDTKSTIDQNIMESKSKKIHDKAEVKKAEENEKKAEEAEKPKVKKYNDLKKKLLTDTIRDTVYVQIFNTCDNVINAKDSTITAKDSVITAQKREIAESDRLDFLQDLRHAQDSTATADTCKYFRKEISKQKWQKRGIIALWLLREGAQAARELKP